MEAALRTAYYYANGRNPQPNLIKYGLTKRGLWKEGICDLGKHRVRIAVAHGLKSVRALLDAILSNEVDYDFVEIMACPDGCIGGGGQPITEDAAPIVERREGLCNLDIDSALRFAHENPMIVSCYEECLGIPLSDRACQLLHIGKDADYLD